MRCRLPNPLLYRLCLLPTIGLTAIMLFAGACTGTARDRVMHFFFEYPDNTASGKPLKPEEDITAAEIAMAGPTTLFAASRHRPFVEHRCQVCHNPDRQFAPRSDMSVRCKNCHAGYFEDAPYRHAPALRNDCILCHTMHASRHGALLRFSQDTLCISCHDAQFEDSALTTYHRGIDTVDCTACHNPHASVLRMLLKPEAERPRIPVDGHDNPPTVVN